jgi:hypothetical protein
VNHQLIPQYHHNKAQYWSPLIIPSITTVRLVIDHHLLHLVSPQ